jgi:hypothetical protein
VLDRASCARESTSISTALTTDDGNISIAGSRLSQAAATTTIIGSMVRTAPAQPIVDRVRLRP